MSSARFKFETRPNIIDNYRSNALRARARTRRLSHGKQCAIPRQTRARKVPLNGRRGIPRKRIRNRVPRQPANNVTRTPGCVLAASSAAWEHLELSCALARDSPFFVLPPPAVLPFRRLLLFSGARSSSLPLSARKGEEEDEKKRIKGSDEEGERESGETEGEGGGERERSPLLLSSVDLSTLALSPQRY